jgi:glycosyltransferase involved in cell wall biosynthesis
MRTYERPVLLARAIASVQNQSFTNWHLIVVNNGGDATVVDRVVNVARNATPAGSISVLHLPERVGMEEASNEGLRATQSKYFAIHDDDDSWSREFLARTVAHFEVHPHSAAIVSGLTRIYETYRGGKVWPVKNEHFWLTPERITYVGMIGGNTFPPIAALFDRRLITEVGEFDSSLPVLGDWEFNLRAVNAGGYTYLPERLAHYHTRTPESEVFFGNSITVGIDQHRIVKKQLQERWSAEPEVNGVNKGQLSVRVSAEIAQREAEEAAREAAAKSRVRRVVRGLKHPMRSGRGVVRRVRAMAGR